MQVVILMALFCSILPAQAQVTIGGPAVGMRYAMDKTYTFAGIGTDSSGNPIGRHNFYWKVHYRHDDHWHDNLVNFNHDSIFIFTTPQKGELTATVYYRVQVIVPYGRYRPYDTVSYNFMPDTSVLRFKSVPEGIGIKLFGTNFYTNLTISEVENGVIPVSFKTVQTIGGIEYRFRKWSFGDTTANQVFYTPATDTTFTLIFEANTLSGGMLTTPGTNTLSGSNTLTGITQNLPFVVIYPNPAMDYLYIVNNSAEKIISASIYPAHNPDKKTYIDAFHKIPLMEYPDGVYFLEIHFNTRRIIQKFIKHQYK